MSANAPRRLIVTLVIAIACGHPGIAQPAPTSPAPPPALTDLVGLWFGELIRTDADGYYLGGGQPIDFVLFAAPAPGSDGVVGVLHYMDVSTWTSKLACPLRLAEERPGSWMFEVDCDRAASALLAASPWPEGLDLELDPDVQSPDGRRTEAFLERADH